MKKVLAWTDITVLLFVLIAFLVSLATPAPQVAAYDPQVAAGQPVGPSFPERAMMHETPARLPFRTPALPPVH